MTEVSIINIYYLVVAAVCCVCYTPVAGLEEEEMAGPSFRNPSPEHHSAVPAWPGADPSRDQNIGKTTLQSACSALAVRYG